MHDEHIWLKAYCAVLGRVPRNHVKKFAEGAVEDFHARFDIVDITPEEDKPKHPGVPAHKPRRGLPRA